MGELINRKKRLLPESVLCIGSIILIAFYFNVTNKYTINGWDKDFISSMVMIPVFCFLISYITGRWIFCYTVKGVNKKGIQLLFRLEMIILYVYFICIILFGIFGYIGDTNTGVGDVVNIIFYVYFYAFSGSSAHQGICLLLGIIFAFVITGKEIAD